jgi:hypothetical protein
VSDELTAAEVLRRARKVIEDPERWTAGFLARDSEGGAISPRTSSACRWCAMGAVCYVLERQAVDSRVEPVVRILDGAAEALGYGPVSANANGESSITRLNDHGSHAEVLAAFDKAIAAAEKA